MFQPLITRNIGSLRKNASQTFYRFRFLPSNGSFPNIVLLDLCLFLKVKNIKYDFCRFWYLPSDETIAKVLLFDLHRHYEDHNCKVPVSWFCRFASTCTRRRVVLVLLFYTFREAHARERAHTYTHTVTLTDVHKYMRTPACRNIYARSPKHLN